MLARNFAAKLPRNQPASSRRLSATATLAAGWMLISSWAASAAPTLAFPAPPNWQPRFQGIDYALMVLTEPRPLRGHVARIDLTAPGIGFVVTPDNGERPEETDGLKTTSFLQSVGCELAINANPFSPVRGEEGLPQDVRGLLVNEGTVISPADSALPALLIDQHGRATVVAHPLRLAGVRQAIAGFGIVLKKGEVVQSPSPLHPRTAAGVSPDGRCLYLLVIDGRQPGYSEGATTAEVGAWLQFLGADDGINLDGGGTSTMVFRRQDGSAEVVNRPIHAGIPGRERVAGAHLGVRATPLKP